MPFDAHKPKQKPIVIIRTASAHELSNYEKYKLKTIEENAQENKIETIKLAVAEEEHFAKISNKEAVINLGELALENKVSPDNISLDELFFIECSLDALKED
jgi:hypothetical protein